MVRAAGILLLLISACSSEHSVSCEQLVAHLIKLEPRPLELEERVAQCTTMKWTAKSKRCLMGADSAEAAGVCMEAMQSFGEALRVVCDAPLHAGQHVVPSERAMAIAKYASERIVNPDAIALFAQLAVVEAQQKRALLTKAAAEAGISDCKLAKSMGQ